MKGYDIDTHGYQQGHLEDYPEPWFLIECSNEHLAKGLAQFTREVGCAVKHTLKCFTRDESHYVAYIYDEGCEA